MKRFFSIVIIILTAFSGTACKSNYVTVDPSYFVSKYNSIHASGGAYVSDDSFEGLPDSARFLYQDICFSSINVPAPSLGELTAVSAACFDLNKAEVIYSKDIFERVYPASTTKLLTAYVASKYTNPSDIVTISKDNCGIEIAGAQLTGFKAGDTITMEDLLYCLLMFSANDAAVAIAEHVSGSVDAFCKLMNTEAKSIGATGTHFTNPHGLQDPNHYTTAYDIYLIFNECLKDPFLKGIMTGSSHISHIYSTDGTVRDYEVVPTNYYAKGLSTAPDGIKVLCGKTGETIAAKNCLIIYSETEDGHRYITELFKAKDRDTVYREMNLLLEICLKHSR